MLIALFLAAASPAPAPRHPTFKVDTRVTAAAEPRRSRYRLEPQAGDDLDMKQAALAADGSACSIVGGRVCTRKPRTVFAAAID